MPPRKTKPDLSSLPAAKLEPNFVLGVAQAYIGALGRTSAAAVAIGAPLDKIPLLNMSPVQAAQMADHIVTLCESILDRSARPIVDAPTKQPQGKPVKAAPAEETKESEAVAALQIKPLAVTPR